MAYLEKTIFQNGNLTVSGYSKEGAIIPSMGIDTFIAFRIENLTNIETLLSINKVNFPLELVSSLFTVSSGNPNVTLSIYPDILATTVISQLTLSSGVYTFPSKTLILPTHKVTIKSSNNTTIPKLIIYAKPVDIYEVSNG